VTVLDVSVGRFLAERYVGAPPPAVPCWLVADWVWHCTGIDPVAAIRDAFPSHVEAMEWSQSQGGIVAAMDGLLSTPPLNLLRTGAPEKGDVGVIEIVADGALIRAPGIVAVGGNWWFAAIGSRPLRISRRNPTVAAAWSLDDWR